MFPIDRFYLQQALALARRGRLSVSPNPMVGCIIVKNGRVVGEGWHIYAGGDHAEIMALKQAQHQAQGANVYVTLEPCCHIGRTGACTDALIKAKVKKVIIAVKDPNSKVSGKGIAALKNAGIEVITGIETRQATELNKIFFYFHHHKRPYVIAKWGMALDGYLTVQKDDDKQITGCVAQAEVHDLRNCLDAVMVGARTVIEDNPMLNVRLRSKTPIRQPLRVIVSSKADLPTNARVFDSTIADTLLITSQKACHESILKLKAKQVECIYLPTDKSGKISPHAILEVLAEKGITSVLLEGGQELLRTFFDAVCVNEVHSYIAPVLINGFEKKHHLIGTKLADCGEDVKISANIEGY